MKTLSRDTSPEAERLQIAAMRALPAYRKVEMIAAMNRMLAHGALDGLKRAHPAARDLETDFYADDAMMRDALRHRSSFNLIHFAGGFKVDVFVSKGRAFDRAQFERRIKGELAPERDAFVSGVEGSILAKLEWYRLGNEVSERQWSDVLGVLKVQAGALDLAYLRYWAADLGVSDLLERALADAGI